MTRGDTAFVHPAWKQLSDGDLRVLLALALSRPNRLALPTLVRAYQPEKTATDSLISRVIARLQPAVCTYGLVIVREGKGYRLADRPRANRAAAEKPVVTPTVVGKLKPEPKVLPTEPAPAPRSGSEPAASAVASDLVVTIRDLEARRYSKSQIAAVLRVSYAEVERVLAGGGF